MKDRCKKCPHEQKVKSTILGLYDFSYFSATAAFMYFYFHFILPKVKFNIWEAHIAALPNNGRFFTSTVNEIMTSSNIWITGKCREWNFLDKKRGLRTSKRTEMIFFFRLDANKVLRMKFPFQETCLGAR